MCGSGCTVLTARGLVNGEQQISTLLQNRNPWTDRCKIWQSRLCPWDDALCKIWCASGQIGEILHFTFLFIYIYLISSTHLQVRPLNGFWRAMPQTTRVVLLGFKMLKLTTNPFSCAKGQILAKNGLWNFLTKISKLCRPSNVPSCKPMIELLLSDSSFNLVSFVRHLCGTSVRLFPCRRSSLRFSSWQTDVGTR